MEFHPLADEGTQMKMTMTFTTPRFAARMVGEANSIARLVENRMLKSTLTNFREVMMREHDADASMTEQEESEAAKQSALR